MTTQTKKPVNADTKKAWIYAKQVIGVYFARVGNKLYVRMGDENIEISNAQIKKYAAKYDETFEEFEKHLHKSWNRF